MLDIHRRWSWRPAVLVALTTVLSIMTATAINAAAAEDRWPGLLETIRRYPFVSAGLFAGVSVLVAVVLVATGHRQTVGAPSAAVALLGGDPLDGVASNDPASRPLRATGPGGVEEHVDRQPSARPSVRGGLPLVWNLPPRSVGFVGRRDLLARIHARLGGAHPVVLLGTGGLGKTALAIEYANRFAASFELVWWIDAERVELVSGQLASLAVQAGWVDPRADRQVAVDAAYRRLRQMPGWLLVLDNAEDPTGVRWLLPQGPGQVLLTSRNSAWAQEAEVIAPGQLTRAESVALLRLRAPSLDRAGADGLAEELGDLPLALVQAAGVLEQTGMPAAEYRAELAHHPATVLSAAAPTGHACPLARTVAVAAERLQAADPTAAELLNVCAFLAPEPVPVQVLTGAAAAERLPGPLAAVAGSPFLVRQAIGSIGCYGLAEVKPAGLVIHRLTQAVLRDLLDRDSQNRACLTAEILVAAAAPERAEQASDYRLWPYWARLLPHLLALAPAASSTPTLRQAAIHMTHYLISRGELRVALSLATDLYRDCQQRYGPDAHATLASAYVLAWAYSASGRHDQASPLAEHVLSCRRRILGDEHPDTLLAAQQVANNLGNAGHHRQSLQINQHLLAHRRRILGDDNRYTLAAANNLGENLRALGEVDQARAIHEDVLARRRNVDGHNGLGTLTAASSLAEDLQALGLHQQSEALNQDTLARARSALGDDHELTAHVLAMLNKDHHALGDDPAPRGWLPRRWSRSCSPRWPGRWVRRRRVPGG
jgi:tetratricopeptide (TPR) repeat protein